MNDNEGPFRRLMPKERELFFSKAKIVKNNHPSLVIVHLMTDIHNLVFFIEAS